MEKIRSPGQEWVELVDKAARKDQYILQSHTSDQKRPSAQNLTHDELDQERFLDLEQQKNFLVCINHELKIKTSALESQKEALTEVLERGITRNAHVTVPRKLDSKLVYVLVISAVLLTGAAMTLTLSLHELPETQESLKTRYLTENLRGDTVDTWKLWKLDPESTLVVSIANSALVGKDRIDVIRNAILSGDTITLDDSLTHKGLAGSASTYFLGWKGALEEASAAETKYVIPAKFRIIESDDGVGNIIITLSAARDQDGYSGFTKSTVDGNEILKSQITIYDVGSLSDDMLAAITRHEFGHAIGLGHSTAPEDLMAPSISMQIPYISECNVDAIAQLYDENVMGRTVCEK